MADRFQHLFDSLNEEVVGFDQELRLVYANSAWLNGVGLTLAQVLDQPCYSILRDAEGACAPLKCIVQEVFRTGRVIERPCPTEACCGLLSERLLSVSPVFDEQDRVVQAFAIAHPSSPEPSEQGMLLAEQDLTEEMRQPPPVVGSGPDLQLTLNPILKQLYRVVEFDTASIALLEKSGWRVIASHGLPADLDRSGLLLPADDRKMRWLQARKQPLIIPGSRQDLHRPPGGGEESNRTWIGAPIISQGRFIGSLYLYKQAPDYYTTRDADLVMVFANQAAGAIENARLYEEVSCHLEEVQILSKVSQAATSTLDFDEVVRRSIATLLHVRSFERASILLLDEDRQELCLHPALVGRGTPRPREDTHIPLGKGITGTVAQTGQPRRVADVRLEPSYLAGYPDTLSELCVPLRIGNRVIGVLDVQSTRLDAFSESDELLLSTLAGQMSTLLENSRLFAETQQRVRELTALMQASQALNQAEGLETVLNIVLDETFNLTGSQEGSVILIDPPDSGRLRIVAEQGLGPENVRAFNDRPVYAHEGTYKRALGTGQMVEVHDTSLDPDFLQDVGSQAGSVTNIPLLTQRGAIGLIAVDGLPRDDTTRRLLTALASMAAVAIDKERLHQETASRLAEVSTLYTLSTQITTSLSSQAVLEAIVSILRLTLDCRSCSIFLLEPDDEFLKLEAGSGPSATWKGIARLRVGEGISGRVISERRSIYVPDTQLEPDFIFFDPQIRSLLVVPLIVRNKAVGTLSIDDTQPNAFDDELRLLAIAAAQCSVAIDNAQLYESLQESYQDLEQAYKGLRELDKIKSELIQNISHELRTPLTFIRGYVELLQDGEMGPLQEEQRMALEIVNNKAEVLSKLVEDIITMQLVSREQLHLEPLSLAKLGHVSARAAMLSAQEAGLALVDEISDDVPRVWGDRRRLGQVFDNLLQNAIKFSRPGDTITVRTRFEKGMVRAEVEDTGIGMAPDQLSRIFDRFYQVNGTTTRRFSGTGLGLAIVKQIVEAHDGQVGVKSELDKGSLFYFAIPPIDIEELEDQ